MSPNRPKRREYPNRAAFVKAMLAWVDSVCRADYPNYKGRRSAAGKRARDDA